MVDFSDLAQLPLITKFIEGCLIDSIPAGAVPKDVMIQLPDGDGAKVSARYTGFPPGLVAADEVAVRVMSQDPIRYLITNSSGATAKSGGWPFATIRTVSTTDPDADHATIAAAITAASAGDIILLDAETWGNAIITKAVTLMGLDPVNTILTTTGTKTINVGANGVTLRNLTVANTGTSAHSCIESVNDNLTIQNCIINKVAGSGSGESRGIYNSGGDDWLIDNCRVVVTDGATKYAYHADSAASSAKIIGGSYEGSTDDINLASVSGISVELSGPWLVNDDLVVGASASWTGNYHQSSDGLWIPQKFVGARVYNSANITLTTSVVTLMTYNSERWDNDSIHSTVSNTGRLTCQTDGYYLIDGHLRWATNSTGQRTLNIKLNGTTFIASASFDATAGSLPTSIGAATLYYLVVGDYVEMFAFQNTGGNLDIASFGNYSPEFAMHRMAQ